MRITSVLFAVTLAACATASGPVPAPERARPNPALEREAIRATAPEAPLRIVFDWTLRERDARFSGRGVARIAPEGRARLDLFGPRGATVLRAAVAGGELRLPPGARTELVPPVSLLWAAVGVFRPPAGAELVATERENGRTTLWYRAEGDTDVRWRFVLEAGRLRYAERTGPDRGRLTVELAGTSARGLPGEVVFRDYSAYRELTLAPTEVEVVDAFPQEIWHPGPA